MGKGHKKVKWAQRDVVHIIAALGARCALLDDDYDDVPLSRGAHNSSDYARDAKELAKMMSSSSRQSESVLSNGGQLETTTASAPVEPTSQPIERLARCDRDSGSALASQPLY